MLIYPTASLEKDRCEASDGRQMSELGQTEKIRHRRRRGRLTSNNGNIWLQAGTAVPCQQEAFAEPPPTHRVDRSGSMLGSTPQSTLMPHSRSSFRPFGLGHRRRRLT